MTVTPNMRSKLDLPPDALMVLNVVHLGSAFARKNPLAAIAAFRRAFGDAKDRVLVIKLIAGGATRWAERALHEAIAGANNIRLVEGMLPEADMMGLTSAADIVISLHRSEGFGLVPAQAMALGKPVIATGWSGNLEFMTKRNSALVDYSLVPVHDPEGTFGGDGQMWAEADVDDATQWLRRLASDASFASKWVPPRPRTLQPGSRPRPLPSLSPTFWPARRVDRLAAALRRQCLLLPPIALPQIIKAIDLLLTSISWRIHWRRVGRAAAIDIFKTHDVVFAEIASRLHFDQLERNLAGICEPVDGTQWDIRQLVLMHQALGPVDRDHCGSANNHPMFGPVHMLLQRQGRARADDQALHLESLALIDQLE